MAVEACELCQAVRQHSAKIDTRYILCLAILPVSKPSVPLLMPYNLKFCFAFVIKSNC